MIYIGSDHAGYELKLAIIAHLESEGIKFVDCGGTPEPVDYPDIAHALCEKITNSDKGILVCGTGVGMSIAANKVHGIRAAAVSNTYSAKMSRADNNTNVLCLGGRVLGGGLALDIVDIFLETEFGGGRHAERVAKLEQ